MAPASPRAARIRRPTWLDGRLILGAVLVLTSVALGTRVLAGADRTDSVWAVSRPLAAGTTIAAEDLQPARVRLFARGDAYIRATGPRPLGWVLDRPLAAGELLPREALSDAPVADVRLVTVPVSRNHFPAGLRHGERVDVYLSRKTRGSTALARPELVLDGVAVDSVEVPSGRLGGTTESGVVLRVPTGLVPAAVGAVQGGALDLVRVPAATPARSPGAPAAAR